VMVWELGQSHCGKNTRFETGPVKFWEEHSVWDWVSHFVGSTQAGCVCE
jgi:hypothetical protein